MHARSHLPIKLVAFLISCCLAVFAQTQQERTLDEIKTEAIRRSENGMYPLIGLDPTDVREAFNSIHTKDKDEWAAAFMGDSSLAMAKHQADLKRAISSARAGVGSHTFSNSQAKSNASPVIVQKSSYIPLSERSEPASTEVRTMAVLTRP